MYALGDVITKAEQKLEMKWEKKQLWGHSDPTSLMARTGSSIIYGVPCYRRKKLETQVQFVRCEAASEKLPFSKVYFLQVALETLVTWVSPIVLETKCEILYLVWGLVAGLCHASSWVDGWISEHVKTTHKHSFWQARSASKIWKTANFVLKKREKCFHTLKKSLGHQHTLLYARRGN